MPDLTQTSAALIALAVFVVAYVFVIAEEFTHLRKSKPVVWRRAFSGCWSRWPGKIRTAGRGRSVAPQSRRIRRAAAVPAGSDDLREHARGAACLCGAAQRAGGARVFISRNVLADRRDGICAVADPRQSHDGAGHGRGGTRGARGMPRSSRRPASTSSWPRTRAAHSALSATSRR